MRVRFSPQQRGEQVCHLRSEIPTIDRAAIDNHKLILEAQLLASTLTIWFAELKQIEANTTWHHLMGHVPTSQSVPGIDDWPNFFRQSHNSISSCKCPALHRFC